MDKLDYYILGVFSGLFFCLLIIFALRYEDAYFAAELKNNHEQYDCVNKQVEAQSCSIRFKD